VRHIQQIWSPGPVKPSTLQFLANCLRSLDEAGVAMASSTLTILRAVAPRPDVVNIGWRRRVAENCHYHYRRGHRNDSG
jgi:hypothetical protein